MLDPERMDDSIPTVSSRTLEQLQALDTCTVSNAIEKFRVRTRNEGFANGHVRCIFPELPPKVGYAATARIRTSATPIAGPWYYERIDFWSYLLTIPAPRVFVAEDVDHIPGLGALFGQVHATISKALDTVAYITDGAVRDLQGIAAAGLQAFAGNVAVSHAYAHIVEFGEPVEVGGLRVKPGDLLHGDRHGILNVPTTIAAEIPDVAAEILATEHELLHFCRSQGFSFEGLAQKIQHVSSKVGQPHQSAR